MRPVRLHAVEAGIGADASGVRVVGHNALDLRRRHLPRAPAAGDGDRFTADVGRLMQLHDDGGALRVDCPRQRR